MIGSKGNRKDKQMEMIVPHEYIIEMKQFIVSKLGGSKPVYVNIIPFPGSVQLDCGRNAEKAVRKYGGKVIKGWRIWWIPGILYVAQAHAIWEKSIEEFVDVTPTSDDEKQSLFVCDGRIAGVPGEDCIPSEYWNIVGHPKVNEYIRYALELDQLRDRGKVAGLILPLDKEEAQLRQILVDIEDLVNKGKIYPRRGDCITEKATALQRGQDLS